MSPSPFILDSLGAARDLACHLLAVAPLERRGDELFLGGRSLTGDAELVDRVKRETGFGCTLFAGNLRVATTATAAGSRERAYGTRANDDITRQVLRLGQPFRGITETLGKDWVITYEPLRAHGRVVGMVAVYRELVSFAADLGPLDVPEAVLRVDGTGVVQDASTTAVDFAGVAREELIGRPVTRWLVDLELSTGDLAMESSWMQPDAYAFSVQVQARALADGHLLIVRDFSSETRAREALVRANAELDLARRKAEQADTAKSMFLANVSHELRTPLTAILGFTELVLEDCTEQQEEDLGRVREAGRYLLSLIDDLLDLTRARSGHMVVERVVVELDPIVDGVVVDLASRVSAGVEVARRGRADWPVLGDARRIRQVLLNLTANAAKFTDEGRVLVIVEAVDDGVAVHVDDSGVGMDEVQVAGLFESFSQVHRARRAELGGTGLGLALSRRLARAMGGELSVSSVQGHGSRFTLVLPTVDQQPAAL